VGVVLVGDADRVADDLDRRLRQQEPIPDGTRVLLLLDRKGRVLKAFPDIAEHRKAVRDAFPRTGE